MTARLVDLLLLRAGYNSAVVVAGAAALGLAAGVVGSFVLLRRRVLVSDAIGHAALPGVALAFLAGVALTGSGRHFGLLLLGAVASGTLGVLLVQAIRDHTRLPEDSAIATVLSLFFSVGVVLLSHIQTLPAGGQAGLNALLLGSAATMSLDEARLVGGAALAVVAACALLTKEFGLLCFDAGYAAALGWPVRRLDLMLSLLLLAVVAIGLKTVGLILIVALVALPPVAARCWTDRLGRMAALSGGFGALAAWLGAAASSLWPRLPTGGLIVLVAGGLLMLSLLCGPARGLSARRRSRPP
ncbi:iron chelate uptake ABC transporter family permease subunit [Azoarcus indigens]|uniref:Manganese/zinc/iron transport system permease protein n=1 Tax=Azoarcus indigens TaxID=29545 RepID=A0A4R6E841_9RHOO|nr:metal ABC transporter permease [Azoarcus indigens]NMG65457.1 iron chelate uptake ABC transporter family permease subunit [Azoarcus indigens]TDN53429.1 manganese/zinc/iron transport system permease protein [Azoarcus indigens]